MGEFAELFGSRLREAREEQKLSQADVAAKVGITSQSLSNYERGTQQPPLKTATNLAKALNVSLDYLCDNTEALPEEQHGLKTFADLALFFTAWKDQGTCAINVNEVVVKGKSIGTVVVISLSHEGLIKYFSGLKKMSKLLEDGIIDKTIFGMWCAGQVNELQDSLIPLTQPFYSDNAGSTTVATYSGLHHHFFRGL